MLRSEHYMHAAAEAESGGGGGDDCRTSMNEKTCAAATTTTPTASSDVQERVSREYTKARAREGLGAEDLGFGTIVTRTSAVLIGFFTSFVYSQIAGLVQGSKTWQMAMISLSVTLVALAVERIYLDTLGRSSFAISRNWSAVMMPFMRFFTIIMVFLTTNFGLAVFTDMTTTAQMTWYEGIAMVYISMLSFFFFYNAYKREEF